MEMRNRSAGGVKLTVSFVDVQHGDEATREPPGTYYGSTLTSQLRGATPNRSSIKSLECSRLRVRNARVSKSALDISANTSRPTSAQSRGTTVRSRATSAKSIATSARSDFPSAHSRTTTARSRLTSAKSLDFSRSTSRANVWESSAQSGTLCTSMLSRPMTSVPVSKSPSSAGRRSLRSRTRRRSPISVASTGITPGHENGKYTDLGSLYLGLCVWFLEKGSLVHAEQGDIGFFHQENCYIVLQNSTDGSTFLHLWQGSLSGTSEQRAMRKHLKRIDLALEGSSFFSIEHEGHETPKFLSHFEDGFVIVEGRRKQPVSKAVKYTKRLYTVEGLKYLRATCSHCVRSKATDYSVLILDGYPRIYIWIGSKADYVLRLKAMRLANKMRTWQRGGKGHIVVVDATEEHMREAFLNKLQDDERGEEEQIVDNGNKEKKVESQMRHLYRLNGDRVMYDMPLVAKQPLQQKYLTTMDCYLLDSGPSQPVVAWVGNAADFDALYNAIDRAQVFAQDHNYPSTTAICRLTEGEETQSFKNVFCWWRDRAVKERKLSRNYTIANVGRALYSATDRRTVAKLAEVWSDDHILNTDGSKQVYKVDGGNQVRMAVEDHGVFFNRSCYIVLHRGKTEQDGRGGGRILYYWVGSKCSAEEELQASKLACAIDASLWHTCAVLRVLDGKEPRHFFAVFQGSMVVYDTDQHSLQQQVDTPTKPFLVPGVANMFCIREMGAECMRVEQVPPLTSYLNSSAAYIVISDSLLVWYGKYARGNDREYAKNILTYFCPERARDYSIINEGKETSTFWLKVENNGDYFKEFREQKLQRRVPSLAKCQMCYGEWSFQDIPNFSQEDLNEHDLFILDSHDQIQIWCGNCVWHRDSSDISQLLKEYLNQDPCARCREDVSIWIVNQGHEPTIFTRHFSSWDPDGYGGNTAYQVGRKRLRQENARIDINLDWQVVDYACGEIINVPYRNLVKEDDLPKEIDLHHKEDNLSDEDFARVLRQTRSQFYRLPRWKQTQILRSARLSKKNYPELKQEHSTLNDFY